ncbi:helix-turn-helix domain-containing protein [Nonomuraea basaltis]|uniref:helix-turn-helix domain-containing protein n=1 Tax=Nonomuraea basaltis TaxID=2495887 RepID=UPI00110C4FE2|nr:helix-turn-helix domain-containing protein [Nonomuraea basaltis]TMR99716.1 helix-turn-helix transcriptional regulator [Nonomuraea basaltis]
MDFAVGALIDIDDYVASTQARGQVWARRQLDQADHTVRAATRGRPTASCTPLPPDEWLVTLAGDDPDTLMGEVTAMAEEIRARIIGATVTVSLGTPHAGPGGLALAEREARRTNSYKLLLGGDRVITAPSAGRREAAPPVRIEAELARRIQAGDRNGVAGLLAGWVDRCAQERDLAPATLHNWLVGELLFVVDVVNKGRLSGGSTDWVDACARLPIEELISLTEIHERSYLRIWMDETLKRLMPPRTRDILSMAEAYMATNYAHPRLRLSTVAEAVSASPFYISHLFAEERGTTFLRYLTGLRLRHARSLLSTSALPIEVVAGRSGYLSAKAFRGVFKRHVGCSPSEYRRTYRKG